MERTFAWLATYRRLLILWESVMKAYRAFFRVALIILCLRPLLREL